MFENSIFNNRIDTWNFENVKDMSYMFAGSAFNQPLNGLLFNIEVKSMAHMFENAQYNKDLDEWSNKIKHVEDMSYMFAGEYCMFNKDISDWNVDYINTGHMFEGNKVIKRCYRP